MKRFLSCLLPMWLAAGQYAAIAAAAESSVATDAAALADLSLEELTNVEVTTLSKRPQRAADAAAAVFVITQDDIRRSGATTIPEALRLAPGLHVAQIDSSKWAISARGDVGRFANKLLVLMDGRTLYTPTFGGVYWDVQDTLIEDIERIEVILGPGGAIWGANAVNGIINIITKSAAQTNGVLVSGETGIGDRNTFAVRYGVDSPAAFDWRIYGRYLERGSNEEPSGARTHDRYSQGRIGARADVALDDTNQVTAWIETYRGESGESIVPLATIAPALPRIGVEDDVDGVAALLKWVHTSASGSTTHLQATLDNSNRDGSIFSEERDTYELDFEWLGARRGRHTIGWGAMYRNSADHIFAGSHLAAIPARATAELFSAFAQDEVFFLDERFSVTLGAKLEDDDRNGSSFLPSLRVRYTAPSDTILWTAISRGTRTPSRVERDGHLTTSGTTFPSDAGQDGYSTTVFLHGHGNGDMRNEDLTAYEAGVRRRWGERFSLDASIYLNDYRDVRGTEQLPAGCLLHGVAIDPDPHCLDRATYAVLPFEGINAGRLKTRGGELSIVWKPLQSWRLIAGYSYYSSDESDVTDPDLLSGFDPRHRALLRSSLSLGTRWDWDLALRHVDELPRMQVPAYTELDMRIGWRPTLDTELALAGNNLLHDRHQEFLSEFGDLPAVCIQRSIALQLRWSLR